ncbi:MAG: DUF1800 family protein, partial [Saprospiraceae bacterium]
QQNRKDHPNENFARELLELFTIGRGNYTEQDIKEAARAFTGWGSNRRGEFIFKKPQHDFGQKTFMGKTGNFSGEDIINIVLEKPATAEFITRKIYRYFVNDHIDKKRVKALAASFYKSDYNLEQLLRTIFTSDWFYAKEHQGAKIKSPVELLVDLQKQLNLQFTDPKVLYFLQKNLGQILFQPPNVAGWAGGQNWIDNSTLLMRLQLPKAIYAATHSDKRGREELSLNRLKRLQLKADYQQLGKLASHESKEEIFEQLNTFLLPVSTPLPASTLQRFVRTNNNDEFIEQLCLYLMSLPEYQMC